MFLYGCEYITDEEYRDRGVSDGYAVGYDTTYKIRATLTYGYDNKIYKEVYSYGYAEGAEACRRDYPENFYGR